MASGRALWVALGLAGCAWQGLCGCAASPPPLRAEAPRPRDPARALIELVPGGGDECEVVRTARAPDARLPLLARIGSTSALAWRHGEPRILAYVATSALSPLGGRARRVAVELSALPRDRDVLEEALGLRVRWEGEPCEGVECRYPVVRSPRERVLVIEHGEWPSERIDAATGDLCADAVSHDEDAVSVSTELSAPPGFSPLGPVAHRTALVLREGGVEERTTWVFEEDEDAARYAEDQREREEALGEERPARVELRGRSVVQRTLTPWDELELAELDAEIALRLRARGAGPRLTGVDAVDVSRLESAREQIALREAVVRDARGAARAAAARALASLLRRTLDAHPLELDLAERFVRLCIDELGEPERARAEAERILALGAPPDPWAVMLREARVHASIEDGARALVDAEIVPVELASRAVLELRAMARETFGYAWAEAVWRWARALVEERVELRAMTGASLRGGGALGALALFRDVESRSPPVGLTTFVLRVPHSASREPIVARPIREGPMAWPVVHLASLGVIIGHTAYEGFVPEVSRALFEVLPHGERTIVDIARRDRGESLAWRARLELRRDGDDLEVLRADAALTGAPWRVIDRHLAQPLASLHTRLFPVMDLTVAVESPELAERLAGAAGCVAHGTQIECAAPTGTSSQGGWIVTTLRALFDARLADTGAPTPRSQR